MTATEPVRHVILGVTVTNHAPQEWQREGGAHWEMKASCGAKASAIRRSHRRPWRVTGCQGIGTFEPDTLSNLDILAHLRELLLAGLWQSVKELSSPNPELLKETT